MNGDNNSEGQTKPHNIDQRVIKEVAAWRKKDQQFTNYFSSDEFNQLLSIIRKHDRINQQDLLYETKFIEGLPAGKFGAICNTVYHVLELDVVEDPDSTFPKYHIDHKGIRFHLMIGQGSTYWTTKLE